ncbi:MAG: TlpA family protein disulfide reductase [Alistipes sp.]|jgi:thiol-disulfide isomerase/thioredoxin|nr:TlpA family protein disulfide reductase [Alistipes sp.]
MKKMILMAVAAFTAMSCGGQSGEKYQEIAGLDTPEGVAGVALSQVVAENEYTLLDFWASWCAPCMGEVPFLTEAYAQYKPKGFEIYGVSYDQDGEAWRAAIADNGMNWVHVSALKGWDCPTAALYGVRSIPRNMLIDKKGNIVAENLRGEALAAKLAELLK